MFPVHVTVLNELKIEGYKLLKDVTIQLSPGFNVITGETGAGKSLILGALKFLLGAKGGEEIFAKGEDTVKVTGSFILAKKSPIREKLIHDGILDSDESEIFIERTKERDGRSRFFLGGRRANLPIVKEFRQSMVDFLEQHQASRLTERSALDVLDSTGDIRHQELREKTQSAFNGWMKLRDQFTKLETHIQQLTERRDLMEFQLKELKEANLVPGEIDGLNRELQILAGATELRQNAFNAWLILSGDETETPAMHDMLSDVIDLIQPLAEIDPAWSQKLRELRDIEDSIREISRELNSTSNSIQDDPQRLQDVERRIALIERLKRKYVCGFDDLIAMRERLVSDVESIQTSDDDLEKLRQQVDKTLAEYNKAASALSDSRRNLAKQIEKELRGHLNDLDLPNAKVKFAFDENFSKKPSPLGLDDIEILLSTNPSEDLKPLRDVASGGEATRISLALKALWAEREGVPILVLDEGDIGIGGDTAYQVGDKFSDLAKSHQLIVVSHLAQVAAFAQRHFRVKKSETRKSAGIMVDVVDSNERVEELARMIGGSRDIDSSMKLAKNLVGNKEKPARGMRTGS